MGRKEEADKILEKVNEDMDVIENQHYHMCLMMYKGEKTPEELMTKAREMVTIGYGVANWYYYTGEEKKAVKILKEIVSVEGWAGFGYIAAEADLYHM